MKKNLLLLLLLLIGIFTTSSAQFGSAPGGHPPWINWQQIETDSLSIIFPAKISEDAQRAANLIHYMYRNNNGSIGQKGGKVNIVLRNQNITPNGFVSSNPFRSEFFTTPPLSSFAGTVDWLDLLTIHEYRHVMQANNSKLGISKLAYILAGEAAWWGTTYLAVPNWFDEGDAVIAETAFSLSGRGRLPSFQSLFRAFSNEGISYSYEQLRNGSYSKLLPNHYPLGYMMTTYARNKFGNDVWKGVYRDAVAYKGIFWPFSKSLAKHTGLSTPQLYQEALNEMDSIWNHRIKNRIVSITTPDQTITTSLKNNPTSYFFPQFLSDDELLVVKSSFRERPGIYLINSEGRERLLFRLGRSFTNYFSYKNGKVVWHELAFHPRWSYVNYSVLKSFDLATGKIKNLTSKTKLISPELSNDGRRIVALEITPERKWQLKILDADNGSTLKSLANPDNAFYTYPRWSADDRAIIAVARKGQTNALVRIDIQTGQQRLLIPHTANLIEEPFVWFNYVFFTASFSGFDNIHAIQIGDPTIYQVTNEIVRARQPSVSPDGQMLVFGELHAQGTRIKRIFINQNLWKAIKIVEPVNQLNTINSIATSEGGSILENVPGRQFPVKKYKELDHLFRIHSWAFQPVHPTYSLFLNSTNYLGTLNFELGPEYNYDEDSWALITRATYSRLFPVFDIAYNSRFRRSGSFLEVDTIVGRQWNESALVTSMRVPLDFSNRDFSRRLEAGVRYDYRRLNHLSIENQSFNDNYNVLGAFFNFSNLKLKAVQQLNSTLGHSFEIGYRQTVESDMGKVFYGEASFYLPGLARTHSLLLTGGYQKQLASNKYKFSNFYRNPRGFSGQIGLNDDIFGFGVNYSLPLLYPNRGIKPLFFIKRIRANLFYDYSKGRLYEGLPRTFSFDYSSVGIELSGDVGLLRSFELPLGIRFSYLVDKPEFVDRTYKISFILK